MNEPIKIERWLDALIMSLARMYAMPINFYLGLLEGEACHISGGCINTYLRNPICSTHSLACKTFSHPMAWWIYRQIDLRCLHSQCKCPLFCWWSLMKWWRTSMCFVLACWTGLFVNLIALSLSHSNGTFLNLIPKSFKVAFIQRICAQQLPEDIYFAYLMTMKQVIFPTIDMCPRCSSFQPCIPHNPSRSNQLAQS